MYSKEFIIPQDATLEISGNKVKAKGTKGELEKQLVVSKGIMLEKVDGKVKISSESDTKNVRAVIGSTIAHIRNMADGVTKGYVYKLKVVYSHFPVTVKAEGKKILIQNFLGERTPRIAKIVGKTDVKIEGTDLTLSGLDIDDVSRSAANIEQAARISGRDRRIFQDGVWITSKGE